MAQRSERCIVNAEDAGSIPARGAVWARGSTEEHPSDMGKAVGSTPTAPTAVNAGGARQAVRPLGKREVGGSTPLPGFPGGQVVGEVVAEKTSAGRAVGALPVGSVCAAMARLEERVCATHEVAGSRPACRSARLRGGVLGWLNRKSARFVSRRLRVQLSPSAPGSNPPTSLNGKSIRPVNGSVWVRDPSSALRRADRSQ